MTGGSASEPPRAPLLVLGLGNPLLRDDGVGLRLLEAVETRMTAPLDEVEFLDGGTQGIALLGEIGGRRGLLILDAIGLGAEPGCVHVLRGDEIARLRAVRSSTAHEGNALEMLATVQLVGDGPEEVAIVGVEPAEIQTGMGLSDAVVASLERAASAGCEIVEELRCKAHVLGRAR